MKRHCISGPVGAASTSANPEQGTAHSKKFSTDFYNSVLEEGGVLDLSTCHMFKEVDGEVEEFKYCSKCGKWHTLDKFYKVKANQKDGLAWYCKEYYRYYGKGKRHKKKTAITKPVEEPAAGHPSTEKPSLLDMIASAEALLSIFKEKESTREEDDSKKDLVIARLEAELKETRTELCKVKDEVSKKDPRTVLMDSRITIRDLFEAIAAKSGDKYTFFAMDNETGLQSPVRLQETISRVRGCFC